MLDARGGKETGAATATANSIFADPLSLPFRPFRMLTGPAGVGKSGVLTYTAYYARKNGWICVFMPDSWDVMQRGLVLVKSSRRPGMVDQHDMAAKILKDTLLTHGEQLAKVPQRGRYANYRYLPKALDVKVSAEREAQRQKEEEEKAQLKTQAEAEGKVWDPSTYYSKYADESDLSKDRAAAGYTLRDMLEWGLNHMPAASDTLVDFLEELRGVTEFPVLIAVDGVNLLYDSPSIYPVDGELVEPERLTVPSAFHFLDQNGFKESKLMKRGMVLTSVTHQHGRRLRMFDVVKVRDRFR